LMVKACSFFSTHWVAKAICLLIRSGTPLLIKANNQKGYSYIELRIPIDLGLYYNNHLHQPKTPGGMAWAPSLHKGSLPDSRMFKEDIKTCGICAHPFETELLLPKVPNKPSRTEAPAQYYITSYGNATFGTSTVHVERQSILDK
ncbi:hypothetical protein E2320_021006, partial [Naja naja]